MLGFGGAATHRCDTRLLTLWYSKVVGVCSLSARAKHMGARAVRLCGHARCEARVRDVGVVALLSKTRRRVHGVSSRHCGEPWVS